MNCIISQQIAEYVNDGPDFNDMYERAADELIARGVTCFDEQEIELSELLIDVAADDLINPILYSLVTGDLMAIADLRLLVKGKLHEKLLGMAEFSH